jgi:hypothetical protein
MTGPLFACHVTLRVSGSVRQTHREMGARAEVSRDQFNRQLTDSSEDESTVRYRRFGSCNRYDLYLLTPMRRVEQERTGTVLAAHPSTILPTLTNTMRPRPIDLDSNTLHHAVLCYTA